MFPWCNGENIPIEMHGTALVFRLRKDLCNGVAHAEALVSDNELYAVKSAFFQPYKEAFPTFRIFFHTLCRADDLTVTVLVYADGDKNTDIFKLSAPVALEVNTVYIDIRVLSGQLAVTSFYQSFLSMSIFLHFFEFAKNSISYLRLEINTKNKIKYELPMRIPLKQEYHPDIAMPKNFHSSNGQL